MLIDIAMTVAGLKESVTVAASIDRFQVVPARPTNSLFGTDKPLAEIPRSISIIESDHIARYDVRTVNDLVTVAPGSFTGSYFGVPGSLFVRGEPGDNFFRGFRRVENRGNYAHASRRDGSHRNRPRPALTDLRRWQDRRLPQLPPEDALAAPAPNGWSARKAKPASPMAATSRSSPA
jgi:hypothetical protein